MSSNALDRIGQPAPAASFARHVGQATAVEQARAVAEVQAAVVVAQQMPRDLQAARRDMLDSCSQRFLAERAFFRYNRAGSQITGPSVHLARELARCWGNFQYGMHEMRRDDRTGESEMQAWAWDVQTNTRNSNTFIVKHSRDTKDGPKPLTDGRDIYENNANNAARRLREAILSTLPTWFVEEAKEACREALRAEVPGKPLAVRIDELRKAFHALGVTDAQLVDRMGGRRPDQWVPEDVAALGITWRSITNGEVSRDEEFPEERVTVADIAAQQARPARKRTDPKPADPDPAPPVEDPAEGYDDAAWLGGKP